MAFPICDDVRSAAVRYSSWTRLFLRIKLLLLEVLGR